MLGAKSGYETARKRAREIFLSIDDVGRLIPEEEKTVTAAADEVLTLVVNGVQRDIAAGATFTGVESYSFTDTAVRNSGSGAPPWEPGATPAEFNFRQALLVTADGIDQDASVTDAISGTYDDTSAKDVAVTSEGDFFNGIYVSGAQYAIDGA